MICPFCHFSCLKVVNSRDTKSNTQIWRRKKCLKCGEVITTYERIDLNYLKVVKRSGAIVRYSRAKLFSSIFNSAMQRKKVDKGNVSLLSEEITHEVETHILLGKSSKITTEDIRSFVLKITSRRDIQLFLSYYAYHCSNSTRSLKSSINKFFS